MLVVAKGELRVCRLELTLCRPEQREGSISKVKRDAEINSVGQIQFKFTKNKTMDSNLTFKKLSQKDVYSGYREILGKKFELPDGSVADYEIIHSKTEVVTIVALDENGNLILVKQFRPGIEKVIIEFPGGSSFEGESLVDSVKRELEEETGYITDDIIEVGSYHVDSVSDTLYHAFLAKNCKNISKQELDKTEFIEIVVMSQLEYEKYFKENRLSAINLLSYFLAKPYI